MTHAQLIWYMIGTVWHYFKRGSEREKEKVMIIVEYDMFWISKLAL